MWILKKYASMAYLLPLMSGDCGLSSKEKEANPDVNKYDNPHLAPRQAAMRQNRTQILARRPLYVVQLSREYTEYALWEEEGIPYG